MWNSAIYLKPGIGNIFSLVKLLGWIVYSQITIFQVLPLCGGSSCPSNVQKEAFTCFGGYSTQLLSMQKSSETLFTGVDVELLRSFCSAYLLSMNCVETLKSNCPSTLHQKIDNTLYHFRGARDELSELCKDDALYEVYARHMTCYLMARGYSERCFDDNMNVSAVLLSRFDDVPLSQLCRDFRKTLTCIQSYIRQRCGDEAAGLVPVLVRPMIRRSNDCELNKDSPIILQTTTLDTTSLELTTESDQRKVITDSSRHRIHVRHNLKTDDDKNSATSLSNSVLICLTLCLVSVWETILWHG